MKMNTIFNTHPLHKHYSFKYTKTESSKTNVLDLSIILIFLMRWINSTNLYKNRKSNLTLRINVRLKVTRVICILISRVVDLEKKFYL